MGRESRANPVANAAAGDRPSAKDARQAKQKQQTEEQYVAFLARQVASREQFEELMKGVEPRLKAAVRSQIWHALLPAVQATIPEFSDAGVISS